MIQPAPWTGRKEPRFHTSLDVTHTLSGPLALPLHVVTGAKDGPTVGLIATIHGDETAPAMMIRRLLNSIEPSALAGRICALPVANPLAMAVFNRQTPEQHGKTDLHEVFPGSAKGNLTQMLAHTVATRLVDHVDVLIDYHCGGLGGRLQERVDYHRDAPDAVKAASRDLSRRFGTPVVHENALDGSAVAYANAQGKTAFNAETAGVYLSPDHARRYADGGVAGFRNVLTSLGMLAGEPSAPPRQLLFTPARRFEANPSRGGHLESFFQDPADLGKKVTKGTRLGELIDMYSLEVVEELVAPVDGYLFFSRYSGVIDAGTKAFAIAAEEGSQWLE